MCAMSTRNNTTKARSKRMKKVSGSSGFKGKYYDSQPLNKHKTTNFDKGNALPHYLLAFPFCYPNRIARTNGPQQDV
jgi:hypothetical protein